MPARGGGLGLARPARDDRYGLVPQLREELEQLPPARMAALRVVQVLDDVGTGAADVARAASVDAALTARMLRMANSAYYGLSGRVGSASFAVTVLGFSTVRSLAAMAAAGFGDDGDVPPGFWAAGVAAASGASVLARRVGADVPGAFCVGMLHDLGTALLWRHDSARHAALLAAATTTEPVTLLELREYGGTHASLAADVLAAWHFPEDLCLAIGRHHDAPTPGGSPLRKALQGGIALAALADGSGDPADPFLCACLETAHVARADRAALVDQVRDATELLGSALTVGCASR
jgi:HD-like signal output (HDOD) protein